MSIIANLGNIINEKNQSSELWQAQRQADRENTNAMQDAGVMQITSDPETYLRYLNCQADNPSYSAGNVALVMVQDQDATIFGTKDRWKSLMRSVSPTEEKNGVKIYTRSSFGKGYVLTDVYDVRQTSGRDLKHTALQPDSKEMTEALKTLLNYCVVPLVSDESIPMPALYDPNQMKMAVNPKYNDAEAFAGIAIEIAHVRFHAKGYNQNYSREDYELDAQSVGYMICRRFGVPCEAPDVSNLAAFYDGFEPQDRRQALVHFDRNYLIRAFAQLFCQHTDAGADFQRTPAGANAGGFRNAGADAGVDDKVLAEPLGKCKVVPCAHITNGGKVRQVWHGAGTPFLLILCLGQYRIILSADTASEVRQLLSQKRR